MKRRNRPSSEFDSVSLQGDGAPPTAFIDPSPLIMNQFRRSKDGAHPAGDAEDIPMRRSSSYRSTHIKGEEGY